jgi:NTE family protein
MSALQTTDFTSQKELQDILSRAEKLKADGIQFSDLLDDDGHQYVDLVQEGGGVLGIALVGYTYVLEHIDIRFFSLAGTSAGAINTLMLAGMGEINEAKSLKILELLSKKNLFDFVDGDYDIRTLIQGFIEGKSKLYLWINGLFDLTKIIRLMNRQLGLNPGLNFEYWVRENLEKNGIFTTRDLIEHRKKLPGLHCRTGASTDDLAPKLVMITSEVTTQTKVQFPEMASLYWKDPDLVHPAIYLRASMSIPGFFYPVIVENIPNDQDSVKRWDDMVKYRGEIPEAAKFVDGGLLSNFPINVFHNVLKVPRFPTFGARLSSFRDEYNKTDNFFRFAGALIGTMRQIYDFDFILRNPDYQNLICSIDADRQFNWLDFNMPDDKKIKLFLLGARKALEFLETFNWEHYKQIREKIAQAYLEEEKTTTEN